MYKKIIKRPLDFFLSLIGIIFLAVPMAVIALLIKLDSPGPVFFRQKRVGAKKKYFMILKFRTMRIDTPKNMPTHLLEHPESYITKIGGFLRKFSLDELPQLFNIFLGDMAVIGPRPALWNQYDLIEQRDKYGANDIRPGLTGLAQINGRDELEIGQKAELDGKYAKSVTFCVDVKCFFDTFVKVAKHEGFVEGVKYDSDGHEEEKKH